jgi:uncharacterized membrane protein YfcA
MNILVILGALLIGLSLGLLGSGGSIITVPLLIYVLEQPAKLAVAESLIIVGCISTFSGAGYIKRGLVNWKFVLLFGLPSMLGTYFGAWVSQYVSGLLQLMTFSIVMLLASRTMFSSVTELPIEALPPRNPVIIVAGVVVGILAGFVGIGGGFLIVPALFLLGKLAMPNAIGTSLIIITMQSFTGFFKYQMVLEKFDMAVNWEIVFSIVLIGIAGSILGIRMADKMPQQKIRTLFGYALVILGTYIFLTSIYQIFLLGEV